MADIQQIVNQTQIVGEESTNDQQTNKNNANEISSSESEGEKNRTDPIVCHDPTIELESIVRLFFGQNKLYFDEKEWAANNKYDRTKLDAIEYPLIAVNNHNIEPNEILDMSIDYSGFLPKIKLIIKDIHQKEQKINTTQMSSIIRVCIISRVDKVYKKILLNFRTYDAKINEYDPTIVTYYGTYYVPEFRQVNTKHIWMESVCGEQNCGQGGHVNANTWEMLHKIAELTGLGFATTKECKEIPDHVIRNIYSQRYDQFIEQQLLYSGTDEKNIFDAWVDLYGYIVMINVPWVFNEDISPNDLTIVANTGLISTVDSIEDQKPLDLPRVLTNYNKMGTPSNLEITTYNMDVNNSSIYHGTLEQVYTINFDNNLTKIESTDIQTKQNSIDGEHIEDYNTGKNRPIPKFNFNDDIWTGLSGGYDINKQKIIRNAYFRKLKQSMLHVTLRDPNLGLQRGTLVSIAIFDSDPINKENTLYNTENLTNESEDMNIPDLNLPKELSVNQLLTNDGYWLMNFKLSGLYYIDSMTFEYNQTSGRIVQILHLIKKGATSGYENRYNNTRLKDSEIKPETQSEPYILENNIK